MVAFMAIAIGAVAVGVILMVGYLLVAQVKDAMPTGTYVDWNGTDVVQTNFSGAYKTSMDGNQATIFAGFGLLAVGIIVLSAFGLISIFK